MFLQRRIAAKVKELTSGSRASLTVLDAAEHSYRPVGNEKLLQVHDGLKRMEFRSTGRYGYGGASVSLRVAEGLRVRVGGGSVARDKALQETDAGRLIVTDKALAFEGQVRNYRWTWNQIADVEIFKNGYGIYRRRGSAVIFKWGKSDPDTCAVIDLMLRRVA